MFSVLNEMYDNYVFVSYFKRKGKNIILKIYKTSKNKYKI